jgi:hypothetical protein
VDEVDDSNAYYPAEALLPSSKKPTAAFNDLAALPPAWSAVGCTNKTLDLNRPTNKEAYLAQYVGVVSATLCKSCKKGVGPVINDRFFVLAVARAGDQIAGESQAPCFFK